MEGIPPGEGLPLCKDTQLGNTSQTTVIETKNPGIQGFRDIDDESMQAPSSWSPPQIATGLVRVKANLMQTRLS